MSASRKKKERNLQMAEGPARKKNTGVSKEMRDGLIIVGVVAVILAAFIAAWLIYKNYQDKKALEPDYDVTVAAATLGDQDITVPIFNYYYMNAINTFYSQYSSLISYVGLDTSKPLDEQDCNMSEDAGTWADYFMSQAESSVTTYYNVYKCALDDGYKVSDDDQKVIDYAVSTIKSTAEEQGYDSADDYLATYYGKGCDLDNYTQFVTVQQVVSSYYKAYVDTIKFTDEEISAKYEEDHSAFDGVAFYVYSTAASSYEAATDSTEATTETTDSTDSTTETQITDDQIQQAEDAANAMKADFDESAASKRTDVNKSTATSSYNEEIATWLFDDTRVAGDIEMFSNDDTHTYYVVKYLARDTHDYKTANIKLIYIAHDTDSTSSAGTTDTTAESTKAPAADRYAEVLASLEKDPTSDNFDQLIKDYSEDSSVSSDSGVKTEAHKNTYPADADEWLFGGDAKEGTYKAFDGDAGYYIIWFTDYGDNYRHDLVNDSMTDAAEESWMDAHAKTDELVKNDDMLAHVNTSVVLANYLSE
jgi:hypothetical protein